MTALRIAGIVLLVWIGVSFLAAVLWIGLARWNEHRWRQKRGL